MATKILVISAALLCALGVASGGQAVRRCLSQVDCFWGECCAKRMFKDEFYCVPLRKEGELCLVDGLSNDMIDGVYDITCPCGEDLKCVKDEHMLPDGTIVPMGNPRCRRLGYAGYGSYGYARSNGYNSASNANANSYSGYNSASNANANSYSGYNSASNANANSYSGYKR